jgi:predicted transcriptional regulator
MTDTSDMWSLLQSTYRSIFLARRKTNPTPPPIAEITQAFPMQHASIGDVMPLIYMMENYNRYALSTADYRIRNCYDNPVVIERQLQALAADGFLTAEGDSFRVTEKGEQLGDFVYRTMRPRWHIPPLHMDDEINRINVRMKQLADATFAVAEPPPNWSVTKRRDTGIAMPVDAHPLERFQWHLYDLWSYRDDAHLATWQPHNISPFAWETFTYIWNGECDSAEKLAEVLSSREYSAEQWGAYVQELLDRQWVTVSDGKYAITEAGKAIRDAAEKLTDYYFYGAWSGVPAADIEELRSLLTALQAELQKIANS